MIITDQTEQGEAKVPLIEHVTMKNGIKADQRKADALVNVERPTNLSALQRLFGLAK